MSLFLSPLFLFLFWSAVGFLVGGVVSSFFEWTLHRFFMHKPTWGFRYPFERHALIHHRIFRADHTYHAAHLHDAKKIPMAWWNGPVLVGLCQLPFLIAALISRKWGLICGGAVACTLYFAAYEYMHWCMHLPKRRHVERSGIFFRLNGHHLLHHRYMHKNFNVVCPLADLLLGTLVLRSKVHFQQAQGPAVPNVQPKPRRTPKMPAELAA
jgi:hypothetical protein